ncbi:aspartate aminotransferase [Conidiobolus coronatus NRRL 28638]|uniref:aspartate transaminase n=1 Tax=Conidiobolus coronatus (strain ATCC 28846 / CBS 209.66 / NRRL 28638) TaxID=796925 RepID=A0A137P0S2_CONC2|nr:aspartate aminotransferase [Conidiobolus coronatus NRRL 28638]|eukprot:KXN68602.1 aspartate aminotransferase [Conidiobolus coronatus NRRL 28638]
MSQSTSKFNDVPLAPPDAIFHLMNAYKTDPADFKVDLSVGAYRTDEGKPWVLPVVEKAEKRMLEDPSNNHEYLGIEGLASFNAAAVKLLFGEESKALKEQRTITIQTISGTGANSLFAQFMATLPKTPILVSKPTWGNHHSIFKTAGFEIIDYPYFDAKTKGLAIDGMLSTIQNAPNGSIVLLHACAHNPTGVDPSQDQWKQIADLIEKKGHLPFFDCAYQGFASGDLERDAWALRYFESRGFEFFVAQSFAKNFGLYGERCGALTFVSKNKENLPNVLSQLKRITRATISNPPRHGAQVVSLVLNDPQLKQEWFDNLKTMANRINSLRTQLFDHLTKLGTPGTWNHIVDQIGMFSFTGLNAQHAKLLKEKYHIYLSDNGRISMAGLNSKNVEYFAKAIDDAVRSVPASSSL